MTEVASMTTLLELLESESEEEPEDKDVNTEPEPALLPHQHEHVARLDAIWSTRHHMLFTASGHTTITFAKARARNSHAVVCVFPVPMGLVSK